MSGRYDPVGGGVLPGPGQDGQAERMPAAHEAAPAPRSVSSFSLAEVSRCHRMRWARSVLIVMVAGSSGMVGCSVEPVEVREERAVAALRQAWRLAEVDSVAEALAVAEFVSGGLGSVSGATRLDSLRHRLAEKRGYLRWRIGDRAGSLAAYGEVFAADEMLLPDSLAAETARSFAYVLTDDTTLSRSEAAAALSILDGAEAWGRRAGLPEVVSRVLTCKAALVCRMDSAAVRASAPAPPRRQGGGLAGLILAGLVVVTVSGAASHVGVRWVLGRRHRPAARAR